MIDDPKGRPQERPMGKKATTADAQPDSPDSEIGSESTNAPTTIDTDGNSVDQDESDAAQTRTTVDIEALHGPRKPRGSRLPWMMIVIAVLAAAFGGGYATWSMWSPHVAKYFPGLIKDPFDDPRMTALTARLAALEKESKEKDASALSVKDLEAERAAFGKRLSQLIQNMETLEKDMESVRRVAENAVPAADSKKTGATLRQLSQRLSAMESTSAAVSGITKRIDALEKAGREGNRTAQAIVLAVGQLRMALEGSGSFAEELKALETMARKDPRITESLAALRPFAAKGIPTLVVLHERFAEVAKNTARADKELKGGGWFQETVNRVTSLVTVRRTDDRAPVDSTDAALDVAEKKLAAGDLAGAVKAAENLKGAAAEPVAAWLKDARARVEADKIMAKLHGLAVSLVAAGKE
jgi:hypothetical protein